MLAHQIIPTTIEHIQQILPFIRQADRDEFWAAAHQSPEEVLEDGLKISTEIKSGIVQDKVICIFGLAPVSLLCGQGVVWMVGSTLLDQYAHLFLRYDKHTVNDWLDTYPHLFNYVDARNIRAKKWLKRLGFVLHEAKPYGKEQLPFHYFERRK